MTTYKLNCNFCKTDFLTHKEFKKYCTRKCFFDSRHNNDVEKDCVVCNMKFFVKYRFRNTKTCGAECFSNLMKKVKNTRETKLCIVCQKSFDVVQSYKNNAKYCSYDPCFLSTRKSRQFLDKNCEYCKIEFKVSLANEQKRFCSKSCSNKGENNGMFGKHGPFFGKKSWNNGLTAKTDERIKNLGEKISHLAKEQFKSGERSNKGEKNPMFGHTPDMLTVEQRSNYSKAAIKRVLDGVSGYNTGHLTGIYNGLKTKTPVRFKSSWELAAMMWWDKSDEILSYSYEPDVICLDDGRRAIPDFFVNFINGDSLYYEIKPSAMQEVPLVAERLEKTKIKIESLGKKYVMIGDKEISLFKKELGESFKIEVERHKNRI